MTFLVAASTKELAPGRMTGVKINGKNILLSNRDGKYFAIGNKCTHMGCSLSDGTMKGDSVQCICHGSTFDLKTGKILKGPAKIPEETFKTKVDGDKILVDV